MPSSCECHQRRSDEEEEKGRREHSSHQGEERRDGLIKKGTMQESSKSLSL